jgi:hypothetical protein
MKGWEASPDKLVPVPPEPVYLAGHPETEYRISPKHRPAKNHAGLVTSSVKIVAS